MKANGEEPKSVRKTGVAPQGSRHGFAAWGGSIGGVLSPGRLLAEMRRWPAVPISAALVVGMVGWALAVVLVDRYNFAAFSPQFHVGVEAAAGAARLFGALVLILFPAGRGGQRLLWVAAGLFVLGFGGLGFGYVEALLGDVSDLNTTAYESLLVWGAAAALFAAGLVPEEPPRLTRGRAAVMLAALAVLGVVVDMNGEALPPLLEANSPQEAVVSGVYLPGIFAPYWALSAIPLTLSVAAACGALSNHLRGTVRGWLLVSMVILAGSQLHSLFWPSTYSPVLSTSDLLQLAFAAVVAGGAVLELRRVALERARLLAAERETTQRLRELARMKADFTAMVAHELNNPLFAIRGLADMLATERLGEDARGRALAAIQAEADALDALANDVRTSAKVEREDFAVEVRPVPLEELLDQAAAYARTLPGGHPLRVAGREADGEAAPEGTLRERVLADPDRVGQVLRNLLSNAAKYSPAGAPIELRSVRLSDRVRIEIADRGRGVHPNDLGLIFEKFGRGRDASGRRVPGMGLGLYLSRRIVRAHGGELAARAAPGGGTVFFFELERAGEGP